MEDKRIRVAITHGDTNGVGYELIFKTFAEPEMLELCTPIIYGSPKIAAYHRKALDIEGNFSIINNAEDAQEGRVNLLTCFDNEVKVDLGVPTPESGKAAIDALDRALTDYRKGLFDILVTAPIFSQNITIEGTPFTGMRHYLDTCVGEGKKSLPIYNTDNLRIAILADDIAMKDVSGKLTAEALTDTITLLHRTLCRDLRIYNPRIAVLAFNADANGTEENDIIRPVVSKLAEQKVNIFGPYQADRFFGENEYEAFDAILAIYHDQGILPLKTLTDEQPQIIFAGLPIVCTTVYGDPDFANAGKDKADENAIRRAIYSGIDIARNRVIYDEPFENPLPKLFHEKRDESEKVRFSIPKKKEE